MIFRLSIRGRLAALAGLALLGFCVLGALAVGSNRISQQALDSLYRHDMDSLVRLQRIENALFDVRFRAAGVLLDQMPVQGSLNHLREVRRTVADQWATLAPKLGRGVDDAAALEALQQLKSNWGVVDATLAKLEQAYAAKDKAGIGSALEDDWPVLQTKAVKPLQALIPVTQKSSEATFEAATAQSRTLVAAGLGTSVACLAAMLLVAWWTMRSLLQPLSQVEGAMRRIADGDLMAPVPPGRRDELGPLIGAMAAMQQRLSGLVGTVRRSARSIQATSSEVATGYGELSGRTEMAASGLQQTNSSMEQMNGAVRRSADSAAQASRMASTAAEVAARGGDAVSKVVQTMDEIKTSSERIADITGVIDGIAFQTNILALNAAVEAARAGEQGRGFAVVASEVRSLAQRSAAAAKEIKLLIGTSVDKVESGTRLAADAGSTMHDIVDSVQRVSTIIGEIAAAASQQSEGIGQVSSAVNRIDEATQRNAALVEQSAAATASLKDEAKRLYDVVEGFKVEHAA